ncbi:hypothetical protein B0H14DRAFT_2946308 [Mycena olivaceomarginata]|nr:hypothetical protein B0H14DRAFT_2946308 [Mycena olivaceomarginata]
MVGWRDSTVDRDNSYSHYFARTRLQGPERDTCKSATHSEQTNSEDGNITTHVHSLDFRSLSHPVSDHIQLDLGFVDTILSSTGPDLDHPWDILGWQWDHRPENVKKEAATEQDHYPWLQWVLFSPAAQAVCAVREKLYLQAQMEIPERLCGRSTTECIYATVPRGVTDILHFLEQEPEAGQDGSKKLPCTVHEIKHTRVGSDVLEHIANLARGGGGWAFRRGNATLDKRSWWLLCQCIDELIYNGVTHVILATPENYVLLFLDHLYRFQISRVYTIIGSATQAADMTELVLFYMHSLLTRRVPYPRPSSTSLVSRRVIVPEFSPRLFQHEEALLRNGPLIHLPPYITRPLPIKFLTSDATYRHDGDIVVSFGRLVFWLFETHIVAKAACQSWASERLLHEFAGVVIPSLFGMHRNLDDGSSILVISYAGETLRDFNTLCLKDRQTLLMPGVLHNDLEPRNVVISERSGPRIIDFDNATLNHTCGGISCEELAELARNLSLDLGELSRAEVPQPAQPWLWILFSCLFLFVVYLYMVILPFDDMY